jgi:membrane protein
MAYCRRNTIVPRREPGCAPNRQGATSVPSSGRPHDSKATSWRDILRGVAGNIANDQIPGRAAQMSFYFFLSVFPMLLVLMAALGVFLNAQSLLHEALMQWLAQLIPSSILGLFSTLLDHLAEQSSAPLSWGIALALWAASSGMVATIDSLNQAYAITEVRPWWRQRLVGLALTLVLMVVMGVAMTLLTYGAPLATALADRMRTGTAFLLAWRFTQWLVIFGFSLLAFNSLYYLGPSRPHVRWRWFPAGTLIAIVLWLAASLGLKFYVTHIGHYSVAYGALGGVIVLLMWFYFTAIAILVGADINARCERRLGSIGAGNTRQRGSVRLA